MRRLAFALALLAPFGALAWPVDVYVDVPEGGVEFQRLSAISWAVSEDPAVATAEVLPSKELLLTGKAKGRTLVLLYAEGKFAVWRVRVGQKPEAPSEEVLKAVTRACPKAEVGEKALRTAVPTGACRTALKALFETDRYRARDAELTFEMEVLQAQLQDIQEGLGARGLEDAKVRYRGAGVILEGTFTPEAHRQVLWTLFKRSVGRVPLEDRSKLEEVP